MKYKQKQRLSRKTINHFTFLKKEKNDGNISISIAKRTIIIKDKITFASSLFLLSYLQFFESLSTVDPIFLIFDSCKGGDCIVAKNMYALIRSVKSPTIGVAKRFVNSAAIVLFAACKERVAYAGTTFQFHLVESEFIRPISIINGKELPLESGRMTATVHAKLSKDGQEINEDVYAMLTEGFGFKHTYLARMLCEEECNISLEGKQAEDAKKFGIVHIIFDLPNKAHSRKKGRP